MFSLCVHHSKLGSLLVEPFSICFFCVCVFFGARKSHLDRRMLPPILQYRENISHFAFGYGKRREICLLCMGILGEISSLSLHCQIPTKHRIYSFHEPSISRLMSHVCLVSSLSFIGAHNLSTNRIHLSGGMWSS